MKNTKQNNSNYYNILFNEKSKLILVALLVIITFIVFSPSLKNDFVRWDDLAYVTENELIKDLSINDLSKFGENVAGNFHPLTLLSYAIDYQFFGLDPFYFHLKNVIYHLLNTVLVFFFTMKLTKNNAFVSFFTALLFGIHPMHVESVTWVSERKDVLYTFFFLAGLMLYYEFKQRKRTYIYILLTISFVLSTLSKSAAVVFPIVLLLIDYFENRKITFADFKQKIPLFIISLVIGFTAINTQTETGAVEKNSFSIFERLQYAANSFINYIIKFFFPNELICYRPFPSIEENSSIFLLSVIAGIVLFIFLLKFRKKYNTFFFGLFFYFITIALVLQFIQVGGAYLSDRYTYMPYIGIGLIYFTFVNSLITKQKIKKYFVVLVIIIQVAIYSKYTYSQTKVWRDTISLWTNLIEEEDNSLYKSYGYDRRGNHYLFLGDSTKAMYDFNKSIEVGQYNYKGYTYRGNLHFHQKNYELAFSDFETALKLNPNYIDALKGKGAIYTQNKNYQAAIEQFKKVVKLNSRDHEAWNYMGYIYMQQQIYDKALECYDNAINIKSDFADAIRNRAIVVALGGSSLENINLEELIEKDSSNFVAYTGIGINHYKSKNYDLALESLNKALDIKPDFEEALRTRAAVYWEQKQYRKVIIDITEYLKINPSNYDMLNRRAMCYVYLSQFQNAIDDFSYLIKNNPLNATFYQSRGFLYIKINNIEGALNDFLKAKELGLNIDENIIIQLQAQARNQI